MKSGDWGVVERLGRKQINRANELPFQAVFQRLAAIHGMPFALFFGQEASNVHSATVYPNVSSGCGDDIRWLLIRDQRCCMNSAAMRFIAKDKMEAEDYGKYLPDANKPQ